MTRNTFSSNHGYNIGGYSCNDFSFVASSQIMSIAELKPETGDCVTLGLEQGLVSTTRVLQRAGLTRRMWVGVGWVWDDSLFPPLI